MITSQVNEGNTMGDIDNPNNMIVLPPITGRNLLDKLIIKRSATSTEKSYIAFADIFSAALRFQVDSQQHALNCVRTYARQSIQIELTANSMHFQGFAE